MLEHAVTLGLEMWGNKYKDVWNLNSRECGVLLAQEAGIYNFDNYKVFAESWRWSAVTASYFGGLSGASKSSG